MALNPSVCMGETGRMGGDLRLRIGPSGRAALHEMQALATRILDDAADADAALVMVMRVLNHVDPREKERVVAVLRRERGPRLTVPGDQRPRM
jgi:hypothetical protein